MTSSGAANRWGAEAWPAPMGLSGYRWRAAAPRAMLLLQHGYAEHAGRYVAHYGGLIPRLTALGFDVYAFDLAGHGHSPGERGVTDLKAMVDAHVAARQSLAQSGRPLFLFGHSLGGLVTAASVARDPAGVAGVALSGPALLSRSGPLTRGAARLLARIAPGLGTQALGPATGISRVDAEVRAYEADPLVFKKRIPALLGATVLSVANDMWGRLPNWQVPVFVMHGRDDSYVDVRLSERFFEAVAAADKELMLVEGGRHELLNDLGGEAAMTRLLGWFEARL